jgi:hypothetical protein
MTVNFHWKGMESWVEKKHVFCSGLNTPILFRNLQAMSYAFREHGTLQTRYPLWYMVRLSVIIICDTPTRREGFPYSPSRDTLSSSGFEPWKPPIVPIQLLWKRHLNIIERWKKCHLNRDLYTWNCKILRFAVHTNISILPSRLILIFLFCLAGWYFNYLTTSR